MSKRMKKKPESTSEGLYYEFNADKIVIHNYKGGKVVFQSGQPTPPNWPPK